MFAQVTSLKSYVCFLYQSRFDGLQNSAHLTCTNDSNRVQWSKNWYALQNRQTGQMRTDVTCTCTRALGYSARFTVCSALRYMPVMPASPHKSEKVRVVYVCMYMRMQCCACDCMYMRMCVCVYVTLPSVSDHVVCVCV